MKRYLITILTGLLVIPFAIMSPAPARAQDGLATPYAGSAERKAIMNALRAPVERELHRAVIFKVNTLVTLNGWARLDGIPVQPNGNPMNYHGTSYQSWSNTPAFGGGIDALLRKRGGHWKVVTYIIGASDVQWVDWPKRFGCPKALCAIGAN